MYRNPGTGKVVPWRFKVGSDLVEQPVVRAIHTNDEFLELQAVLSGSQPARARAFIDLAVKRLTNNREYVLGAKELKGASRSRRPG